MDVQKEEWMSRIENTRHKDILVAKVYSQIPSAAFIDVFSQVIKHSSVQLLFGIVAKNDLELEQMIFKITFLCGELEENIHMQQPESFIVFGKNDYVLVEKVIVWTKAIVEAVV